MMPRETEQERFNRHIDENLAGTPAPSFPAGLARSVLGQGVGMGWGDEAEAALRSKLGQGSYEDLLKQVDKEYGRFSEHYPVTSAVGEFVGGAAPAVGAMMLAPTTGGATAPVAAGALRQLANRIAPYAIPAGAGTVQGVVSGAGTSEPEERTSGAVGGGALGLLTGAAARPVSKAGGAVLNWLGERVLPTANFTQNRALQKITDVMQSKNIKPGDVFERMREDEAMGVPSTIANLDPKLVELARKAGVKSETAAQNLEDVVGQQAAGSRYRVLNKTKEALNAPEYYKEESKIVSDLRSSANNLYDKAYEFGEVNDPKIMDVLENPRFAAFYKKAKDIANDEALDAKLNGQDPSKYQLKQLYRTKVDKDGNLIDFELTDIPDVRTLDYVKRGIDATIESGYDGKGLSPTEARALKKLRKTFLNALDEATIDPETGKSAYALARKKYAGDMEVLDALRSGYNDFNKLDSEQVVNMLGDMSDAEKNAFRSGVTRWVHSVVMDPSIDTNSARKLIGSPETRAKLEPLFDSSEKFDLFKAALNREHQLYDQSSRMLGSKAVVEGFEGDSSNVGKIASTAITGNWGSSLAHMAAKAVGSVGMTDEIAEKTTKMLMSSKPQEVSAAVKLLEDFAENQAPKAKKALALQTGAATGLTTALPSAPESGDLTEGNDIEKAMRARNELPDVSGPSIKEALKARKAK